MIDQDHGIAQDHAHEGDDAQLGDEAERNLKGEQRQIDADQAQRRGQQDHQGAAETLQLQHQQGHDGDEHERHYGDDGLLTFRRLLDGTADFDAIAGRQGGTNGRQLGIDAGRHGRSGFLAG